MAAPQTRRGRGYSWSWVDAGEVQPPRIPPAAHLLPASGIAGKRGTACRPSLPWMLTAEAGVLGWGPPDPQLSLCIREAFYFPVSSKEMTPHPHPCHLPWKLWARQGLVEGQHERAFKGSDWAQS